MTERASDSISCAYAIESRSGSGTWFNINLNTGRVCFTLGRQGALAFAERDQAEQVQKHCCPGGVVWERKTWTQDAKTMENWKQILPPSEDGSGR